MRQRLEIDSSTGDLIVHRGDDVESVLERNKALLTSGDGYTPSRDLRRAATIPAAVIELWMSRYGVNIYDPNHKEGVRRLLNSSEWAHLRTAPGRL